MSQASVVDWALNKAAAQTNPNEICKWTNNFNNSSLMGWWADYDEATRKSKPLPAVPAWDANLELICHEFVLYAAYAANQITAADIAKYYTGFMKNGSKWAPTLNGYWFSSPTKYVTGSTRPNKGDIVVFDDPGHVAIATGETKSSGHSMVVGLWGLENQNAGQPCPITSDSIEALSAFLKGQTGGGDNVQFTAAPW